MRAVIHVHTDLPHQVAHAAAMRQGLERHGIEVAFAGYDLPTARAPDFAVVWGSPAKQPEVKRSVGRILVMERGHLPDRMVYASCGWDAIGRRGRYPAADDNGARWRTLWGERMRPWRTLESGYALLIGQVPVDAALAGLAGGWPTFAEYQARQLADLGWDVRYRPHPFIGSGWVPRGAKLVDGGTLAEDLEGAAVCVTYNSTTGVEAVLAGVPTITLDEGAMAWPVTGHDLGEICRPDREAWAHDLAWTNWTLEEIAAGDAWARLAPIMDGGGVCSA